MKKSEQPASGYCLEMASIRYRIENLVSKLVAAIFIMYMIHQAGKSISSSIKRGMVITKTFWKILRII